LLLFQGGYFPEVKAHPEKYIHRRGPEFREWLRSLRENGKYLYVITGSHFDFANHVASFALGEDWKDLFDIVIFFARKPSFFFEKRPFWRLDGANEIESFDGWEDLETGDYYSQVRTLHQFYLRIRRILHQFYLRIRRILQQFHFGIKETVILTGNYKHLRVILLKNYQ